MMYFVYVLKSKKDDTRYTGITNDLTKRLDAHNKGYSQFTRMHRPYRLIYFEELPNRVEARKREKYLKSGFGRQFLAHLKFIPL